MTEALTLPQGILPVLVLAHDGIDPDRLGALETAIPGLHLAEDRNTILQALAQSWSTLDSYGPLKGHRESGRQTGPDHPWFGAEHTDAARLMQRLGITILTHVAPSPNGARVVAIVSRQLFWTEDELRAFCGFFMAALPHARLLLPLSAPDQAEQIFADRTGWRADAARNAVTVMAGHAGFLADTYSDRAIRWDLDADAGVPDDVVGALTVTDETGGTI